MCKADDLTAFIVPNVKKIRGLNLPDPHGPVQACSGTALLCFKGQAVLKGSLTLEVDAM